MKRDTKHNDTKGRALLGWVVYCIEGTGMRQLGFKVRRLLFLNRY